MRLYIAGGIADYAGRNKVAFDNAENMLEYLEFETLNPWRNGVGHAEAEVHMRRDIEMILYGYLPGMEDDGRAEHSGPADGIAVLPGGELSRGCEAEIILARALHLPVLPYYHVIEHPEQIHNEWMAKYGA